jgi:hypothetical protein
MKMNEEIERRNKILAAILVVITLISAMGAIFWFKMYAPLILN